MMSRDKLERDRLAYLRDLNLLGSKPLPAFSNLLTLAADLLDMDLGAISLVDADTLQPLALKGLAAHQLNRNSIICNRLLLQDALLCIPDTQAEPNSNTPHSICGNLAIGAYIGKALKPDGEHAVGLFCMFSEQPHEFSESDIRRFDALAEQASQLILLSAKEASLAADTLGLTHEQQSLNREIARNEVLLHNAAAGIIRINAKGRIETANPMVEKIFGYSHEELIGQNVSMLMNNSEASEHDHYLMKYQRGQTQADDNTSSVIGAGRELTAKHKSGRSIAIHLAVSEVRLVEGEPTEFIGIITDMTNLKRVQEELERQKALLSTLHEGLTNYESLISGEQIWEFLRDSLMELSGADYALIGEVVEHENAKALRVRALTDLSWDGPSLSLMEQLIAGDNLITNTRSLLGRVFNDGEIVLTDHPDTEPGRRGFPEGHPPLYNLVGIPVQSSGETIGMIAVANTREKPDQSFVSFLDPFVSTCALLIQLYRQMDERERFLKQSEDARIQIAAANKAKTEFLSSMSHELRTPLNSVIGFSQLLINNRKQPLPERQAKQVTQIYTSGKHLLTLINEILDLAKIEAGKLTLSLEPTPIQKMVEEAVEIVEPIAAKAGISLSIVPPPVGIDVDVDYTRFKQILINLLSNAIKYNKEHGWVSIAWKADGDGASISVTDSGIGIAPEDMEKLFEPFNRLGAENSTIEGTGVGLALTRKLVEYMQGTIDVESSSSGSCFTVKLPVARIHESHTSATVELASDASSALPSLTARARVLYIEDNPANQKLMEDIFEDLEHLELTCAHDPKLGLSLAVADKPELIICDIHLPGMDGYQVLKLLKANPETDQIPVIALSANAMPSDVKRGLKEGFLHYLTKPLDIPHLLNILDELLDS